jgi:hypothetical protein
MDDDVLAAIAACNEGPDPETIPTKVMPATPVISILLTAEQKTLLINYMLRGVGKGIFEDVPAFWEGVPENKIDDLYPAYREAAEKFIDQLREHALTLV